MKRLVLGGTILAFIALPLTGCNSSDSASPSDTSSSSEATASPSTDPSDSPSADPNVKPPSRDTLNNSDMLRLAVSRFETQIVKEGGATFQIRAGDNENPDTLKVDSVGNEEREWTNDDGQPAFVYTIVDKGVYTSKSGLDPTGVELMDAVAPNASWMLDTFNAANYVPLSPARILEAVLAYANTVECKEEGKTKICTVASTGMSSMPGLGSFDIPADGVELVVTINEAGDIDNMSIFPNNEELKLSIEKVQFAKVTITAPEGETVDYSALVEEQQKRESENPTPQSE